MLLALFFLPDSGPMRNHRQNSLLVAVGPFNTIGNILFIQFWVHTITSSQKAIYIGPTQVHCQGYIHIICGSMPYSLQDVFMGPYVGNAPMEFVGPRGLCRRK
jgi:hypothetical protein